MTGTTGLRSAQSSEETETEDDETKSDRDETEERALCDKESDEQMSDQISEATRKSESAHSGVTDQEMNESRLKRSITQVENEDRSIRERLRSFGQKLLVDKDLSHRSKKT